MCIGVENLPAKPPRRVLRNMVGRPEHKTDQGHECSAQGSGRHRQPGSGDARDRPRSARGRPRAGAGASHPQESRAGGDGRGDPPVAAGDPFRQRRGRRRGESRGRHTGFSRPVDARRQADRSDGGGNRDDTQAERPGRHCHEIVAASKRHAHRAGTRAVGRDRRHLREPSQCHSRRGRAVPEGRQCGDPARRLRKLPLDTRHSRGAGRGPAGPGCPRPRSRSCRHGSGPPSA